MTIYGRSEIDIPDDDAPPSRCAGPAIPEESHPRKCGRFLATGAWLCARCQAETESYWQQDRADEAAHIQRLVAQEAANWDTFVWAMNDEVSV